MSAMLYGCSYNQDVVCGGFGRCSTDERYIIRNSIICYDTVMMSTRISLFGLFSPPVCKSNTTIYLYSVSTRGQESCKFGQKVKELFMQYFI